MAYVPSKYQQAILDWFSDETGNGLIQARAGSGKTSTLVMLANMIPTSARATFLAFNKAIATELGEKLPAHVSASTFHALGFRSIGPVLQSKSKKRAQVDANKCRNLFDAEYGDDFAGVRSATLKLVGLMKASALMPDAQEQDLNDIVSHYDIECEDADFETEHIISCARKVLALSNAQLSVVDFDDMLYLVHVLNVRMLPFDFIMIDEAQDTNEIQRVLLRKMSTSRTRIIAVGDEAQAIYGFRGADSDSMDLIAQDFDCKRLPLSISYRCPASVIALAQAYVPDIEARDNAPQGTVLYPEAWKLTAFGADDLLVCRNTAPLITIAYRMLAARIPCKIMGRDIGRGLVALIERVAGKRTTLDQLPDRMRAYQEKEVSTALARKQEGKAQAIADKCDSIVALIDGMTPADRAAGIRGLVAIIDKLFSDNGGRMTTLATVHKAKGMESPRVFIVDSKLMPSKYARQQWQQQQEANLAYVAITRSLDTLVYLDSETTR